MKYKFIFEKPSLDGQFVALSETEKNIVISTVVDDYSLLLEGFQTGRIVKAIKLLRDYNKPFLTVHKDITTEELVGENDDDGVKEGMVTEASGGFLYTEDLSSLNYSTISWIRVVMRNTWIKLAHDGNIVTLPATFKLIAETKARKSDFDFDSIIDMCDIRYRCEEEELREVYSLNYLQEEIDGIKKFSKDFDDDAVHFTKRAEDSITMRLCKDSTTRLARTLARIKRHHLVRCNDLDSAYQLTK